MERRASARPARSGRAGTPGPPLASTLIDFPCSLLPLEATMRILSLFVIVVVITMTVLATSQTLPAPQAITDPKQITSKPDARVEKSLSIEKLYMTRQVSGSTWSPDGKTVAFVSNLSGRNNLWLVAFHRGWPMQLPVRGQ